MNKFVAALCVSALAALGWAVPTARSAPPTSQESKRKIVAVQVDVTDLPEAEQGVAPVVLRETRAMLEGAGHVILDESTEGAIVLRVRLRRMEAGNRNYGIHFEFMDGDRATPALEWTECVFCTEARVLERIREVEPELLAAIDRQSPPSAESDTGDDTSDDTSADTSDDTSDDTSGSEDTGSESAEIEPIGAMGGVGIGVAALGLGAVVWGAVDLGRGRVYEPWDAEVLTRHDWTDNSPRGAALLGAGIGGVVIGGALLVTDLVIRSKKRKNLLGNTGTLTPMLSSQTAGLGWVQRF